MKNAINRLGDKIQVVLHLHPCYLTDSTHDAPDWHAFVSALAQVFPTVAVQPGVWLHMTRIEARYCHCSRYKIYEKADVTLRACGTHDAQGATPEYLAHYKSDPNCKLVHPHAGLCKGQVQSLVAGATSMVREAIKEPLFTTDRNGLKYCLVNREGSLLPTKQRFV